MLTRRDLLTTAAMTAVAPIAGCGFADPIFTPAFPDTIDIHTHLFNGRDIPVTGFLQQVVLRDARHPVAVDPLTDSFLKLLAFILLSGTPTPKQELNRMAPLGGAGRDLFAQDQARVATAIERFRADSDVGIAGFRTTASNDQAVLDRIATEIGRPPTAFRTSSLRDQSRDYAAGIYARSTSERACGGNIRFRNGGRFLQTIRWAGLLTRSRGDILSEYVRLYGGDGQVRIISPSLLDLGAWLLPRDDVSPVADQIEVMAALAARSNGVLLLSFAPFCPLRAALDREDGKDPMRHLERARGLGFAGVKIYPPMGFLPIGNTGMARPNVRRWPAGGGAALDAELRQLYAWCIGHDIPLKAHANNSIGAHPCSGLLASPRGWEPVLSDPAFRGLRLNLAHFGGFEETGPDTGECPDPGQQDWESIIADMVTRYPGLYFDVGYWTEVVAVDAAAADEIIGKIRRLITGTPEITRRLMYGSDWSMIAREPSQTRYRCDVRAALSALAAGDSRALRRMEGGNAARFLGLVPRRGPQWQRLSAAFAGNAVFQDVFG